MSFGNFFNVKETEKRREEKREESEPEGRS
jgi:hypothetical protein